MATKPFKENGIPAGGLSTGGIPMAVGDDKPHLPG
jgi:hypothetical protein